MAAMAILTSVAHLESSNLEIDKSPPFVSQSIPSTRHKQIGDMTLITGIASECLLYCNWQRRLAV